MIKPIINVLLVEDNLPDIELTRRALLDTGIVHELFVVNHGG